MVAEKGLVSILIDGFNVLAINFISWYLIFYFI